MIAVSCIPTTKHCGEPFVTCYYEDLFSLEDKIIYLYFHAKARELNLTINKIKEQKLFFLSLCRAYNDRVSLTNIQFIRYRYGPFARDLYNLAEFFSLSGWLGVIFDDRFGLENVQEIRHLNECGMSLYAELEDFFKEQSTYLEYINDTLTELGKNTGKALMNQVYKTTLGTTTVESMPFDSIIPTSPVKPDHVFKIPKAWAYTIKFLLTPGYKTTLDDICKQNEGAKSTIWIGASK
jgi:hypothetical protein